MPWNPCPRCRGIRTIDGGSGNDVLVLDDMRERIALSTYQGGAGFDTLRLRNPTGVSIGDTLLAKFAGFEALELPDAFNDVVLSNAGLPTGATAFTVIGGSDGDLLDGAAATIALTLHGRDGDDELAGGSGADRLDAGTGTDVVSGGAGNDTIRFGDVDGDDVADGGAGIDTLQLALGSARLYAPILAGFTGFEALELQGDGFRAVLPAGLAAVAGNASFRVEIVSAGQARPQALLNASQFTARLDIHGGDGDVNIIGGRNADVIRDGAGADRIQGGVGGDSILLTADGAADRLAYAGLNEGSRDIAAAAGAGVLTVPHPVLWTLDCTMRRA